jgi:hypothetical protein
MQTMQTAVDDFEQELEPLVQAQMLADWDAAIDASDDNERQLVDASKRVDAVLAERERYERLVEADRSGNAEGELARRVRLARLASEAGQRERALADRIIESEARLGSLFARHRGQLRGRQVNDNEIAKILREPDMQDRLAKLGMQGADMTTEQIAAFQKAEVAKWAAVIKSANIKLE